MMMQLTPMLPVYVPEKKQSGFAFAVIDYSQEHYVIFLVGLDNGEIWCLSNKDIRMQGNETFHRKKAKESLEKEKYFLNPNFPFKEGMGPLRGKEVKSGFVELTEQIKNLKEINRQLSEQIKNYERKEAEFREELREAWRQAGHDITSIERKIVVPQFPQDRKG